MSIDSQVQIFTVAMRNEFEVAYAPTAEPAPWEQFTQVIPSTARIENYTWMSPAPGLAAYSGHRRFGKLSTVKYTVENKEFDAAFSVLMRDIEDDQTGGYKLKPRELAMRAKLFPGRFVIKTLATGKSAACFDGSNFFAGSHSIGAGNNLYAGTGNGNSDGLVYRLAAMYTGGALKPLLWQDRKPAQFRDNSGSDLAYEAKEIHYWIDLEGQAAFGYWWDAVLFEWTNLPTVLDFQVGLQTISDALRTFTLPKAIVSEDGEYIHEQAEFNDTNMILVGSTKLERIAAQALGLENIATYVPGGQGSGATPGSGTAQTISNPNLYKKWAKFIPSAFMN
jgi:phage major head subunit gpT-like protein